jgi:hypothetical protein
MCYMCVCLCVVCCMLGQIQGHEMGTVDVSVLYVLYVCFVCLCFYVCMFVCLYVCMYVCMLLPLYALPRHPVSPISDPLPLSLSLGGAAVHLLRAKTPQ